MLPIYSDQLKDPRWLEIRDRLIQENNHCCERCNSCEDAELQIHHICYVKGKAAWEYPDYLLRCWCRECHKTFHEEFSILPLLWADSSNRSRRAAIKKLEKIDGGPFCQKAMEFMGKRNREFYML